MSDVLHAIAHGLFHTMQHVIKEYEKEHQRTREVKSLQNIYPNFVWVSQEQRIAEAEKFKSVEKVSELLLKGEPIPESLYRIAPKQIYEFLKRWDRLDLIPKDLENLHLKTKS